MVPIQLDWIAFFIFTGIVQALVLAAVFLSGEQRQVKANVYLGLFLLFLAINVSEIFLCYTGYIQYAMHLIDTTEAFNFVLAPLAYLFIHTKLTNRQPPRVWLHFIPASIYFILMWWFWLQPIEAKINAFLNAYHPELPLLPVDYAFTAEPLGIRKYVNELTLLHFIIYTSIGGVEIFRAMRHPNRYALETIRWVRQFLLQFILLILIFVGLKLSFERDLGDPFLAMFISVITYFVTFNVLRQSNLLAPQQTNGKYAHSSLQADDKAALLEKITRLMESEQPYLNNLFSLSELAKRVGAPTHHVSQVLNELKNQTFFELIATYRIQAAQKLLSEPETQQLKIEEIAERVGYNSKSSFNTAFKKITGMTPSAFRSQHNVGS